MSEVFTFYKAVDPIKGSWDGYGYFPSDGNDFLAFVADAPSGASIHTPEIMKKFWQEYALEMQTSEIPEIELADALNRLQNLLQEKGRAENILYQATLVVIRKTDNKLIYCCIGDSALQILRGDKLFRLSESETWDGMLIAQTSSQPRGRQKTEELRFVGSNGSFIHATEIKTLAIKDQDTIVLSTDGIEDVLPPNQLLSLFGSPHQKLRDEFDRLFAPERIKDDATMLVIPVKVASVFQAEKEIRDLRHLLEQIQRDQNALRKHLTEISPAIGRISKLEGSLKHLSDDVQRSRRGTYIQPVTTNWPYLPWVVGVLCLLIGTAVGALLMRGGKTTPATLAPRNAESQQEAASARPTAIVPPEIPSEQKCSYIVQKGDTLDKISATQKISMNELLKFNPQHKRETPLKIGQTIKLCMEENP